MNDDDLPVLTHVLVDGSGRREASPPEPVESRNAFDVRPIEETPMPGSLVVGNAAGAQSEGDPAASFEDLGARTRPAGDDANASDRTSALPAAALAVRVRDAVLEDLRTRIDTELDARIAQAMHTAVETAVAQLQVNLRAHLTEALRDVVQRAVDEEVARLSATESHEGR